MNDYEWEKMTPLEEVYAIRKRIAEKFGYSLDAIFDAGIKKQREAEAHGEVFHFAKLPMAKRVKASFEFLLGRLGGRTSCSFFCHDCAAEGVMQSARRYPQGA